MKNFFKLFGFIAMLAIIGFSFVSCGDADSGGGTVTDGKAVYTSEDADGNSYVLIITGKASGSAYKPQNGDAYTLVISYKNGPTKTSTGILSNVVPDGDTSTLTLKVSEITFTIYTHTITNEVSVMTEIDGNVPITSSTDNNTDTIIIFRKPLTPVVENVGSAVIGVILNKTEIVLGVSRTETLAHTVIPTNAANRNVSWSTTNTAIATVSQSGLVTGVSAGSATIRVTTEDGSKSAICNVTVTAANQTPVRDDYNITPLYGPDGILYSVSITPKPGKSPGAVTVWYQGTNYPKTQTFPSAIGEYTITFDVAAAEGWNAASGIIVGKIIIESGEDEGITIGNWTWEKYNDSGDHGTSTITMARGTGADSNKLIVSGNITNDAQNIGWPNGNGYAGVQAYPNETELAKLRTATSISFKVKGDGKRFKFVVMTSDITDYSHYCTSITPSTSETTVTINISDLASPGWGQSLTKPFDQSKAIAIKVERNFDFGVTGPFNITLSDITLNTTTTSGGTFTLTGIPAQYNGKYVIVETDYFMDDHGFTIGGAQSINFATETITGALISNGSVSVPMWQISPSNVVTGYTGNHTISVAAGIMNTATDPSSPNILAVRFFYTVTFANGSATRAWSAGTDGGGGIQNLSGNITISPTTNVTTGMELTATYSGNETVSYQWKNGTTNVGTNSNKHTPATAGSYTVTVSAAGYVSKTSTAVTVTAASAGGTFTMTGIPAQYNGKYAAFNAFNQNNDLFIIGGQSVNVSTETVVAVLISGGSVSMPVWMFEGNIVKGYSGNHTFDELQFVIVNTQSFQPEFIQMIGGAEYKQVAFVNGSATRTWNGGFSGGNIPVTGVTINKTTLSLTVGGSETLTATVAPADATNKNLSWKSSATGIATVTQNGLVSAVAAGSATITVTTEDGNKTATCNVTVTTGEDEQPFTSIAAFKAWLDKQPTNTIAKAYEARVNISDLGGSSSTSGSLGAALRANNIKYVKLDLSGSTFTEIDFQAFYTTLITSITIPDSVTGIGNQAFLSCSRLSSITIPKNVGNIGATAFGSCEFLTTINVDSGNSAYASENGILYNKSKTTLHTYPAGIASTSFSIPNTVTSIGNSAFFGCSKLTSITITDSVISIGEDAFRYCRNLTSVTLSNSVTSIGIDAFQQCTSLASITIPVSVTSIDGFAFYQCTGLTSVTFQGTIPSSKFQKMAFEGLGDIRDKFYATDSDNGTPGTYTRASGGTEWTLQ